MKAVTANEFETEVLKSPLPVLVKFESEWCAPCKLVGQTLSKLEPQYAGRVAFVTVDVEEAQELAGQYQVNRLPTLILFEGGQVAAVVVGLQPASNIQCVLDSHR